MSYLSRRRARQTLSWGLLVFFSGQLLLAVMLEDRWPEVRDAEFHAKWQRLQALHGAAPHQPLVLMLGSSRTLMAFRAGEVTIPAGQGNAVAFNFGVSGGGPLIQLVCLRRLLRAGIRPDLLIVELLPPVFNQPRGRSLEEDWLQGGRLRISELKRLIPYHNRPRKLWETWLRWRWVPCATYARTLKERLLNEPAPLPDGPRAGAMDYYGYQPYFADGLSARERHQYEEIARQQYGGTLSEYRFGKRTASALHDLLTLCDRHEIRVALVVMPEASTFRAMYPAVVREGLFAYFACLQSVYGVSLTDASEWLADADFWDSHHPLPNGARVFTARLAAEVITPQLQHADLLTVSSR